MNSLNWMMDFTDFAKWFVPQKPLYFELGTCLISIKIVQSQNYVKIQR